MDFKADLPDLTAESGPVPWTPDIIPTPEPRTDPDPETEQGPDLDNDPAVKAALEAIDLRPPGYLREHAPDPVQDAPVTREDAPGASFEPGSPPIPPDSGTKPPEPVKESPAIPAPDLDLPDKAALEGMTLTQLKLYKEKAEKEALRHRAVLKALDKLRFEADEVLWAKREAMPRKSVAKAATDITAVLTKAGKLGFGVNRSEVNALKNQIAGLQAAIAKKG
jgi:hypothetical protein